MILFPWRRQWSFMFRHRVPGLLWQTCTAEPPFTNEHLKFPMMDKIQKMLALIKESDIGERVPNTPLSRSW